MLAGVCFIAGFFLLVELCVFVCRSVCSKLWYICVTLECELLAEFCIISAGVSVLSWNVYCCVQGCVF